MPVDLPIDVLTELGRVTWAAIKLEDYAVSLCSHVKPVDPRTDRRPVSQKIEDAKAVLTGRTASTTRDEAMAWLERARMAVERRNAALHATPLVRFEAGRRVDQQLLLGEMPRKDRPYAQWPLTVESLSQL